jgi:hypothetical protein
MLVDLPMAGNRLRIPIRGVVVNIVLCAMTEQRASAFCQFPNKICALHATSSSATLLIPGIDSELNVS